MKKIILSLAFIVAAFAVNAQSKGDIVVGGSINVGSNATKANVGKVSLVDNQSSSFSILPEAQYFITDNIAVGAAIGYVSTRELNGHTSDDDPMYDSDGYFYIAPMASYYLKLADKLYYTPKVAIGLGFGSVASEYENSSNKIESEKLSKNLFTIGVNLVQFEYKATDHIALGAGLGMGDISYRLTTTSKDDNSIKKSYFDMDLQDSFSISGINLSVKYYF